MLWRVPHACRTAMASGTEMPPKRHPGTSSLGPALTSASRGGVRPRSRRRSGRPLDWAPMWIVLVACAAGFALCVWRDPRQFLAGLLLLTALSTAVLWAAGGLLDRAAQAQNTRGAYAILSATALLVLGIVVLAGALIANGVIMMRREGRRFAHVLGGLAGVAMLVYLGLSVLAFATSSMRLLALLLALVAPLGFLAYGFAAYLLSSVLYQVFTRHFLPKATAVVVLGAGLIAGRVTPLLGARCDLGVDVANRLAERDAPPVLVVSGGQGPDEPCSEASAMAAYVTGQGFPDDRLVLEDRSRNTAENLSFTVDLLRRGEKAAAGSVIAVTSSFHAFRTALLMRAAGVAGHAVGARTAGYYWPSATIREYAAFLRDHRLVTVVGLALASFPLLIILVTMALSFVGR